MLVKNKHQMFGLLESGALGNTVQQWRTKEELFASGFSGNVYIRYLGQVFGGLFAKNLPIDKVEERVKEEAAAGWQESRMYFGEWIPTENVVRNCELLKDEFGFSLKYSDEKVTQREAFADGRGTIVNGYKAWLKAAEKMSPEDIERLKKLLDLYEGCVVEYTIYERSFGVLGWEFIVWEVRYY